MKKIYFVIGLAIILSLSVALIFYGTYLNEKSELQISQRLEERSLPIFGARAGFRNIRPHILLESVNLYSNEMVDAVALIDGRITESFVTQNTYVNAGDPLFVIVNENISLQIKEADSRILKAQAALRQAENSYERYVRLKENNATSAEKYDEAEARYFAAMAEVEEAQARKEQLLVQDSRQQVTAPVDGRVLVLYRQRGAFVQAGTSLALVGNFQRLYFAMTVDDKTARTMAVGDTAEVDLHESDFRKVFNSAAAANDLDRQQTFLATIADISPPFPEPAPLRNVICQIDNVTGLLEPQTCGNVTVKPLNGYETLTVPLSAMTDSTRSAVYVVKDDDTIARRAVTTGIDNEIFVEILSGLEAGEIVVTSGMEGLEDGTRVTVTLEE